MVLRKGCQYQKTGSIVRMGAKSFCVQLLWLSSGKTSSDIPGDRREIQAGGRCVAAKIRSLTIRWLWLTGRIHVSVAND
jgi:hypothetical protein